MSKGQPLSAGDLKRDLEADDGLITQRGGRRFGYTSQHYDALNLSLVCSRSSVVPRGRQRWATGRWKMSTHRRGLWVFCGCERATAGDDLGFQIWWENAEGEQAAVETFTLSSSIEFEPVR